MQYGSVLTNDLSGIGVDPAVAPCGRLPCVYAGSPADDGEGVAFTGGEASRPRTGWVRGRKYESAVGKIVYFLRNLSAIEWERKKEALPTEQERAA